MSTCVNFVLEDLDTQKKEVYQCWFERLLTERHLEGLLAPKSMELPHRTIALTLQTPQLSNVIAIVSTAPPASMALLETLKKLEVTLPPFCLGDEEVQWDMKPEMHRTPPSTGATGAMEPESVAHLFSSLSGGPPPRPQPRLYFKLYNKPMSDEENNQKPMSDEEDNVSVSTLWQLFSKAGNRQISIDMLKSREQNLYGILALLLTKLWFAAQHGVFFPELDPSSVLVQFGDTNVIDVWVVETPAQGLPLEAKTTCTDTSRYLSQSVMAYAVMLSHLCSGMVALTSPLLTNSFLNEALAHCAVPKADFDYLWIHFLHESARHSNMRAVLQSLHSKLTLTQGIRHRAWFNACANKMMSEAVVEAPLRETPYAQPQLLVDSTATLWEVLCVAHSAETLTDMLYLVGVALEDTSSRLHQRAEVGNPMSRYMRCVYSGEYGPLDDSSLRKLFVYGWTFTATGNLDYTREDENVTRPILFEEFKDSSCLQLNLNVHWTLHYTWTLDKDRVKSEALEDLLAVIFKDVHGGACFLSQLLLEKSPPNAVSRSFIYRDGRFERNDGALEEASSELSPEDMVSDFEDEDDLTVTVVFNRPPTDTAQYIIVPNQKVIGDTTGKDKTMDQGSGMEPADFGTVSINEESSLYWEGEEEGRSDKDDKDASEELDSGHTFDVLPPS
jgi:hypothetical protein